MYDWLKLVTAIIAAEIIEHSVEALLAWFKAKYAQRKKRQEDKKYYSRLYR